MREIVVDPLEELEPEARNKILAARLMASMVVTPGGCVTVRALAAAANLTVETTLEVLRSPEYLQIIDTEFKTRVSSAITKGVEVMDKIIHDANATHRDKCLAMGQLSKVFDTMTRVRQDREKDPNSGKHIRQVMSMMEELGKRMHNGANVQPTVDG